MFTIVTLQSKTGTYNTRVRDMGQNLQSSSCAKMFTGKTTGAMAARHTLKKISKKTPVTSQEEKKQGKAARMHVVTLDTTRERVTLPNRTELAGTGVEVYMEWLIGGN